jgi:hypothetical protein
MPSKHFQDAIREAAASSVELPSEARAHLAVCAHCRESFAEERAFFLAIDTGLAMKANAVVPPAFLHGVRARLLQEDVRRRVWAMPRLLAAGGVAAASLVLLGTAAVYRANSGRGKVDPSSVAIPAAVRPGSENTVSAKRTATSGAPKVSHRSGEPAQREAPRENKAEIEVLVPRDQEALLADYAKELRYRTSAPVVAREIDDAEPAPIEVERIEIAELDVKPLAEEKP